MGKIILQLGRTSFKLWEDTHLLKLSKPSALTLSDQHCREKLGVTFSANMRVPEWTIRNKWCLGGGSWGGLLVTRWDCMGESLLRHLNAVSLSCLQAAITWGYGNNAEPHSSLLTQQASHYVTQTSGSVRDQAWYIHYCPLLLDPSDDTIPLSDSAKPFSTCKSNAQLKVPLVSLSAGY